MNIGSLYKVKKYFWFLFPTKDPASPPPRPPPSATAPGAAVSPHAPAAAAWYSKRYNCEVTYFSPDSYIVFLEEDGLYKKVLTSEGKIGWTWFTEEYNDCFEELKAEP